MFRTSNKRGQERFDHFRLATYKKKGQIELTKKQIKLIEETDAISLAEKIELFLVSLGNKLTTELYMRVDYTWNDQKQIELPNKEQVSEIRTLLKQLPFQYYQDTLPLKNRQNGNTQKFIWFQVSINQAVSKFMKNYSNDLTEFEEGVLYGFPLSAIRAFSRLIDARHDTPNPATFYLSGWCSADFWEDEQKYYQLWWERLRKLSPKTVKQAEKKFWQEQKRSTTK